MRILVDKNGNNLADKVSEAVLDQQLSPVKKQVAMHLGKALRSQIAPLVAKAETHAEQQTATIQARALAGMQNAMDEEHQRLTALKAINPSVRQQEVDFILMQKSALADYIEKAKIQFEAVRLIVVSN
jgi:ATP-dependent helicase HepA